MEKILIIDPQMDFCDPVGTLYVHGAELDMGRLAAFARSKPQAEVLITIEQHQPVSIDKPVWWQRPGTGERPNAFVPLKLSEDKKSIVDPEFNVYEGLDQAWALRYLNQMGEGGARIIWPPHCTIGTWGAIIVPAIYDLPNQKQIFIKGTNPNTHPYSIVRAEVVDTHDPSTHVNTYFLHRVLMNTDILYIGGEADNFCVREAVLDILKFHSESATKMVLLTDCMSAVRGREDLTKDFHERCRAAGVKEAKSTDLMKA